MRSSSAGSECTTSLVGTMASRSSFSSASGAKSSASALEAARRARTSLRFGHDRSGVELRNVEQREQQRVERCDRRRDPFDQVRALGVVRMVRQRARRTDRARAAAGEGRGSPPRGSATSPGSRSRRRPAPRCVSCELETRATRSSLRCAARDRHSAARIRSSARTKRSIRIQPTAPGTRSPSRVRAIPGECARRIVVGVPVVNGERRRNRAGREQQKRFRRCACEVHNARPLRARTATNAMPTSRTYRRRLLHAQLDGIRCVEYRRDHNGERHREATIQRASRSPANRTRNRLSNTKDRMYVSAVPADGPVRLRQQRLRATASKPYAVPI